jgi:hypothetical protein
VIEFLSLLLKIRDRKLVFEQAMLMKKGCVVMNESIFNLYFFFLNIYYVVYYYCIIVVIIFYEEAKKDTAAVVSRRLSSRWIFLWTIVHTALSYVQRFQTYAHTTDSTSLRHG